MLIDLLLVALGLSAIYRGYEIGFVRQAGSTAGFVAGLMVGAWLQPRVIGLANTPAGRSAVAALTVVVCVLIFLTVGEYLGLKLKRRVLPGTVNRYDNALGSVLSVASILISAWLLAAAFAAVPAPSLQNQLRQSAVLNQLNRHLPPAPDVIARLGHLISPNGFPDVFLGREPQPKDRINISPSGDLRAAVERDRASVVKIEGTGCGGVVDGSGFVVGKDLVATNAHVVAGVRQPAVVDTAGSHRATVIWFNPDLDFAVLRTEGLAGPALNIADGIVSPNTEGAVLGYPGGGGFSADPAAVVDQFTALGRDIYNRNRTTRDVYEIQATIVPGNSGGPLIASDGSVIGVVFAASTSYEQVGYALTSPTIFKEVQQAQARMAAVSSGQCAE